MEGETSVKVCVRIRPQVPREIIEMCKVCTNVTPNEPQVWLGTTKAFTFDHVFDTDSKQLSIYETCVKDLIEGCLNGFNATVLAYGQTGSGKTYTMGTGFDLQTAVENKGIIPRAVEHLFRGIRERQDKAREMNLPCPDFKINVQFLELYNEQIIDLLAEEGSNHNQIKIHEDANGQIYTINTTAKPVTSMESTLQCLKIGSLSRSTASTNMNSQSSRSHAIFTLHIKQQRVVTVNSYPNGEDENPGKLPSHEFETLTAKFHFVDLAGSERLKRTGATGDRAKEAVSINTGLLVLGNVISALGDKKKQGCHVPYRDSKLTRLLQDSLGGNSQTLMIACISPSDRDFMETLNTLRYANRAKNIKNKLVVNQDKASETINLLRKQIQQLQIELLEYRQGKRIIGEDGNEQINDMYHENTLLQKEIANLKTRVKALQDTNQRLTSHNTELLLEKECGKWLTGDQSNNLTEMVSSYLEEIEKLRTQLIEMEETCSQLRKQAQKNQSYRISVSPRSVSAVAMTGNYNVPEDDSSSYYEIIESAKREVAKEKKKTKELAKSFKEEHLNGNDNDHSNMNGEEEEENGASSNLESEESASDEDDDAELQLAELSNEISIKEKLILELEKSQRKMLSMKHHYEDKLQQLQYKINEIETERDQVLAKLTAVGSIGNDKAKNVREEYERKLNSLQNEMKKLKLAEKEHAQAMKSQLKYENQMKSLKSEVAEMKKQKVTLLKKIKEEAQKHREAELRHSKKISQLTKQERLKDVKIRTLETETNRVKSLLKRKEEQMLSMKKLIKPMSDKVAGRVNFNRQKKKFTPKSLRQLWRNIEQDINKLILNKKNIAANEFQMERFLQQRGSLVEAKEAIKRKLESAKRNGNDAIANELRDELNSIEENITFVNQNIDDCQSTIMQLEEATGDIPTLDVNSLLGDVGTEEMKYLFEKVLVMAINQSLFASQKQQECSDYEIKYNQLEDSSVVQQQIMGLLLDTTFIKKPEEEKLPDKIESKSNNFDTLELTFKPEKARRLTKTPQELLFDQSKLNLNDDPMTQSLVNPTCLAKISELPRVPSAPSLKEPAKSNRLEGSPLAKRKPIGIERRTNKTNTTLSVFGSYQPSSYLNRQAPLETSEITPPSSPQNLRRNKDDNVFNRLTSGTVNNGSNNPDRGVFVPFTGKPLYNKYFQLTRSFTAEGHSRPVLSVALTEDVMFSGSKDGTVKIWDLNTGKEIQSLKDHPDAVVKVRYNEYTRLAFSVSKNYIKIWDTRINPAKCLKVLNAIGLVEQTTNLYSTRSDVQEHHNRIFDIQLNNYGTILFNTCGQIVRIWDLKKFYCIGKLSTYHSANIICMAVEESEKYDNIVVTGSKDHCIKVFEVAEGIGGVHSPLCTLKPPHYDGIESLALSGDILFSASRDACIKRWDLSLPSKNMTNSIQQAHKDWIQALSIGKDRTTLFSGCRSGLLKLWNTESLSQIGELKAHSGAIYSIDNNSKMLATGSADNTICLWTCRTSNNSSPDFDYINEI